MSNARESAVRSLKSLLSVLAGLTVTNALLIVFTDGTYSRILEPREMNPYAVLCCALLLVNLIRFYHGNVRCIDEFHAQERVTASEDFVMMQPRLRFGLDYLLAYAKSIAFAGASFYIGQPFFFCWVIIALLALEIVWFRGTRRLSETSRAGKRQIEWLTVNGATVALFFSTKLFGFHDLVSEPVYVAVLAAFFTINTIWDLRLCWGFYFPTSKSSSGTQNQLRSTSEIIEDLQSALEELQAISDDLAQTPGTQEGDLDG